MNLTRFQHGQELTEGVVYRRIPNSEAHYDYDEAKPEPAAFLLSDRDLAAGGALSAHLDEGEAMAALARPIHAGFGLCVLDIETIIQESSGKLRVLFTPGKRKGSKSHVSILGCTEDEMRLLLAEIAEVVKEPDKPVDA